MFALAASSWTPWDARAARRAAAIAALALVVAWLVTAATDEGGLTWGVRAGRALPLAPACAAVGTWLALAAGRARGEERAMAALGRSPIERALGAVAGGACVALLAAAALATIGRVDVDGFYPRVDRDVRWRFEGGAFLSDDGAYRVTRDGAPEKVEAAPSAAPAVMPLAGAPPRTPVHARAAAALATALAGVALPLLVARARRRTLVFVALALGLTTVATVLCFQAAAGSRAPVFVVTLPPFVLLALAAASYRPWSWPRARSRR